MLTNLDKMLWPDAGFTKGHMLAYYAQIAEVLVPHLTRHPLTTKRFPDGIHEYHWFQSRCPHPPSWLRTVAVPSVRDPDVVFDMCVIDSAPGLLWVANTGAIELHPLAGLAAFPERPAAAVFDLDPGLPANLSDCCRAAIALHVRLNDLGLQSAAKTSGLKGLHVYVPVAASTTFDDVKRFTRALAAAVAQEHSFVTRRTTKDARRGRVFIDLGQNNPGRSTVAPYSLRAALIPTVSTPLTWEEVEQAARGGEPSVFLPTQVLERCARLGDLFSPVLDLAQEIPAEPGA